MKTKTIGTLTNTNADRWLVQLRGGNVLGTVTAPADKATAALELATPKYRRAGIDDTLHLVRVAVGVYSVRTEGGQ